MGAPVNDFMDGVKFTPRMLPILGVCYHQFASLANAERFARWAVERTRKKDRPCRVTVYRNDNGTGYEVRVANW